MEEKKYLKDIHEIKQLMNRSSRFISLSGLSGILAGIYALTGAGIAFQYLVQPFKIETINASDTTFILLLLALVALFSIATAILLTSQKAKKNNEKIWDTTTKRLLLNFLIPLLTGGLFILINLHNFHYGITVSLMLLFYGLALVNASKYTLGDVKYLGYAQIITGLCCAALPSYGFWFWTIGFGFYHILYGGLMYVQEKNK